MVRTLGPYEIRSKLGRGVASVFWRAYDPALEREVALCEPVIPHDLDSSARADFLGRLSAPGPVGRQALSPGARESLRRRCLPRTAGTGHRDGRRRESGSGPCAGRAQSLVGPLRPRPVARCHRLRPRRGSGPRSHHTRKHPRHAGRAGQDRRFRHCRVSPTRLATEHKTVVGTPGYLAPEQIAGAEVDRRADLFAIGVLGYEMLSGVNPFGASEGLSAATISYRVTHEPPAPFPAEALEGGAARANVRAVLGAALAKDPARRFQSAEEFRAALHGGTVPAGTALLAVAEPKAAPVEPAPVAAGAASGHRARSSRNKSAPRRRRRMGLGFAAAALVLACAVGVGLFFGLGGSSTGDTTTSTVAATAGSSSYRHRESTASVSSRRAPASHWSPARPPRRLPPHRPRPRRPRQRRWLRPPRRLLRRR